MKVHQDGNFSSTSFINMLDNITHMFLFFAIFWNMQLLLSGDIELNPGPSFIDDSVSSSSYTSSSSFMLDTFVHEEHSKYFSIVHLNVQSIKQKIPIIQCELSDYDILAFTESWLHDDTADSEVLQSGFSHPFRSKERQNREEGGVIVYIKDSITAKRREDLKLTKLNVFG